MEITVEHSFYDEESLNEGYRKQYEHYPFLRQRQDLLSKWHKTKSGTPEELKLSRDIMEIRRKEKEYEAARWK